MKRNLLHSSILLFLFLASTASASRTFRTFPKGLGLELGIGHNQLYFRSTTDSQTGDRLVFTLKPTFRLVYQMSLLPKIILTPFFGYTEFGGRSEPYSNDSIDEYWFKSIEFGTFCQVGIKGVQIGAGIKGNRHLDVIGRYFGTATDTKNAPKSWTKHSVMNDYTMPKWSCDLGARIGYRVNHFVFSCEAWFGITDLAKDSIFDGVATSHENHYRVLIGYVLD